MKQAILTFALLLATGTYAAAQQNQDGGDPNTIVSRVERAKALKDKHGGCSATAAGDVTQDQARMIRANYYQNQDAFTKASRSRGNI